MAFTKSLKGKLLTLFFSIFLILSIVAFIFFNISMNGQKELTLKSYAENASTLSKQIAAQFYERYGDIQAFAQNTVLETKNESAIKKTFDEYVRLYGIYDLILFVGMDGKLISANSKTTLNEVIQYQRLKDYNYKNEPWFQSALAEKWTADTSKGFDATFVEDALMDPMIELATGRKDIGSSFTALVKNSQGEKIGIITNRAHFKWVETEFQLVYQSLQNHGFSKSEIQLLNKDGDIIVDFDPTRDGNTDIHRNFENILFKLNLVKGGVSAAIEANSGKKGFGETYHLRKKIMQLSGWTPIKEQKFIDSISWSLLLRTPSDELYEALSSQKRLFFMGVSFVMILGLIVAFIALTKISNKMSRQVREIFENAQHVRSASDQVNTSSQIVAVSAAEGASYIQETTSSMDEILSTVKINNQNSDSAKNLSEASMEYIKVGETKIGDLFNSMTEISRSSNKIKEIIDVIDDIAFQTNLLALNAAVEAARAGEQGRGFAVVAEAVRNLAQKSSLAAKDITTLIQESGHKVEMGVATTTETGEVYKDIIAKIDTTKSLVEMIAQSSQEQEIGVGEVSKAMLSLDQKTQDNAATAEELSAAAVELASQAEQLDIMTANLIEYIEGKKVS